MFNGEVGIRMVIEREGLWQRRSLPSSTIEIRWPMAGNGYNTTTSIDVGR